MPFRFCWNGNEPEFIPVGTTFAAIGADMGVIMLKAVNEINDSKASGLNVNSINPEVLKIAFKEVEQIKTTKE